LTFPSVSLLVDETLADWRAAGDDFPSFGRPYTVSEQERREALLDGYLDRLQQHLRRASGTRSSVDRVLACAMPLIADLSACALDMEDSYVTALLRDGFSDIGVSLAVEARRLDPTVSMADILQACRNAWTACALQLMIGQPLALTPAIFAYSMLYPYSDNYLDDPRVSRRAKLAFSERFRERLAGQRLSPAHPVEQTIWELVGIIESQYPRAMYPQVFESLLAIHAAQQSSISQLGHEEDFDVLRLTFTKGGTSVLADAYLAAGTLTSAESASAFRWGVLLQLGDDLQDLHDDRKRGSQTVFTRAESECGSLETATNRVFNFHERVLHDMRATTKSPGILMRLLAQSAQSLLVRSAVYAGELYSPKYQAELEKHSPYRLVFLRSRERRFGRQSAAYLKLFERFLSERIISTNGGSPRRVASGVGRAHAALSH